MPGQSVVAELLREQDQLPLRRFMARLFGARPLTTETQAWFKGALGEFEVGRLLAGLGPDYTVLHAIPIGAGTSDIDHVVIGPSGVFTVNTKNHSGQRVWVAGGTFMVNGKKQAHNRNAVFEASRTAKLLSRAVGHPVAVAALVVVIEPKQLNVKRKPDGVEVRSSRGLQRWFARQPAVLPAGEVARIAAAACRPELWHRDPPNDGNPVELLARFEALRGTVRSARLRRRLWWGLVMPAGLLAVVAGVVIPFVGNVYAGLLGG